MAPLVIDNFGSPLLVFEDPARYAEANSIEGYWGVVRSSIDWCEHNYVMSSYIAEFFNTLSNAGMVVLGLLGVLLAWREELEARYMVINGTLFFIGVGSAMFHGTLTHIGQVIAATCQPARSPISPLSPCCRLPLSRVVAPFPSSSKATRRPW